MLHSRQGSQRVSQVTKKCSHIGNLYEIKLALSTHSLIAGASISFEIWGGRGSGFKNWGGRGS